MAAEHVAETRAVVESDEAPPPLVDDPRCGRCSHVAVCLPDERALQPVRRQIRVADPDSQVLHLTTPGSRASMRSGRIEVAKDGERLASVPLERVQGVVVHGNVDTSAALIRELLWRDISIVWCSGRGRVVGWARSAESPNGSVRPVQCRASAEGRLDIARQFVASKVSNEATLLRRLSRQQGGVTDLRRLQARALRAATLGELYGIEGDAAAIYFARFPHVFADRVTWLTGGFTGRSRRPSHDPLNAVLNYAYALLLGDVIRAVVSCGLDPHAGFLHSSGRNKPALGLDLMEEFRAPVAESAVVRAANNGELNPDCFITTFGECRLSSLGRRAVVAAYEQRVSGTFTHPVFGYRLTWRRAMEVQARLVLGVLDGTQDRYVGIKVR